MTKDKLPHGMISTASIRDEAVKRAIMKINENIKALEKRVSELERKR